jgi:hypothetical protein
MNLDPGTSSGTFDEHFVGVNKSLLDHGDAWLMGFETACYYVSNNWDLCSVVTAVFPSFYAWSA